MPDILIPISEPPDFNVAPEFDPSKMRIKTAVFREVIFNRADFRVVTALACKLCSAIFYCPFPNDMVELASVHATKQHKWSDF